MSVPYPLTEAAIPALATPDQPTAEDLLSLFFSPSAESRAKGTEYLQRAYQRQEDRDAPTDLATRDAQLAAITAWGIPDPSRLNRLAGITQPTLVVNGDNDRMLHTKNSRLLAEQLPNAELQIYPDANHGFLDQYPELFADDIVEFQPLADRRPGGVNTSKKGSTCPTN